MIEFKRQVVLIAAVAIMSGNLVSAFQDIIVSRHNMAKGRSSQQGQQLQPLHMSVPNPLDTLTSGLASILRLPSGVTVGSDVNGNVDAKVLKLFDIENSAECRKVRERITELDLVVEQVIPAAENSRSIIDTASEVSLPVGTKVPCMILSKSNGNENIYSGAEEILEALDETFSDGTATVPDEVEESISDQLKKVLDMVTVQVSGLMRMGRGSQVSPAAAAASSSATVNRPAKPLILYSYEGNQFCRLVREVLTEIDVSYELRSAGKESPRRAELAEITGGSSQCPYLIDPNTGVSMAESADIIKYLYSTYAMWTPPNELLEWASDNILPLAKPLFSVLAPLQAGSNREDSSEYSRELEDAKAELTEEMSSHPVVVYTYGLSPFSFETKALLDSIEVDYKEVSLGQEWIPGLIAPGGAMKRAALLDMTGQSSLPHIFVGGKPIGGLFSGNPGLLPALRSGKFRALVDDAVAA